MEGDGGLVVDCHHSLCCVVTDWKWVSLKKKNSGRLSHLQSPWVLFRVKFWPLCWLFRPSHPLAYFLPSEWQTVCIQIRPDISPGLIWVKLFAKTQVGKKLSLYTDGFFHLDWYNQLGIVQIIYIKRSEVRISISWHISDNDHCFYLSKQV